jgi:hypothetical protein
MTALMPNAAPDPFGDADASFVENRYGSAIEINLFSENLMYETRGNDNPRRSRFGQLGRQL